MRSENTTTRSGDPGPTPDPVRQELDQGVELGLLLLAMTFPRAASRCSRALLASHPLGAWLALLDRLAQRSG